MLTVEVKNKYYAIEMIGFVNFIVEMDM